MIVDFLLRLGIPTYTTTIYSPLPINASTAQTFDIAKQLPTQIGRIFGMSVYTEGVTPDNKDNITTADAENLYLTFKDGATDFIEDLRLSDLVTNLTNSQRQLPYVPVNIPGGFDLSTSFYRNPTAITAGANNKTVALKLWFISVPTYNTMLKKGIVAINADIPMKEMFKG